jgi:hypothetical protein
MKKRIFGLSLLLVLALVTSLQASWVDLDSESATLLLLGMGLAGIAGFARKRIKH